MKTADVVIIGAGVVGASIAWHLTERGCRDVLLLEKAGRQGLGSTGKATGGARVQFGNPIDIAMSRFSLEFLADFERATGVSSGYTPNGYLFVATDEAQMQMLRAARQLQCEAGVVTTEILDRREVAEIVPLLRTSDVIGGSFGPTDALIDPLAIMNGFTAASLRRGARLQLRSEITAIDVDQTVGRRKIRGLVTTDGRIETRTIINAAGPWAAEVAALAGVDLPVVPLRRHLVRASVRERMPPELPMVIEAGNAFHFRRAAGTKDSDAGTELLMGWPDPNETPGFKTEFDSGYVDRILPHARHRLPFLQRSAIDPGASRCGLYEMTPDHHAIIGQSGEVEGLFFANGFSGHGVMHSPATGRIVAELLLDGWCSTFDIVSLRPERFAEGDWKIEDAVL